MHLEAPGAHQKLKGTWEALEKSIKVLRCPRGATKGTQRPLAAHQEVLGGAWRIPKGSQKDAGEKLGTKSSGCQGLLLPTGANAAFRSPAGCGSGAWRLQDGSKSHLIPSPAAGEDRLPGVGGAPRWHWTGRELRMREQKTT